MDKQNIEAYWKRNLRYLLILVSIWFIVGFVLPLFLVAPLNTFRLAGFPFGFWMAMQGSIIIFVIMMFVYVRLMNKLDAEYDLDES